MFENKEKCVMEHDLVISENVHFAAVIYIYQNLLLSDRSVNINLTWLPCCSTFYEMSLIKAKT
jgi:hypothetical protein